METCTKIQVGAYPKKPFEKVLCNWLTNDLQGIVKKSGLTINDCGIEPSDFRFLVKLHHQDILTKQELRDIIIQIIKKYETRSRQLDNNQSVSFTEMSDMQY